MVYTFTLRANTKWSDGADVTSDDVIFTYALIQSPDFPGNSAWQQLWSQVQIDKIDEAKVRFQLEEPLPAFAQYTTIGILPERSFTRHYGPRLIKHPFNLSPIGTGPFRLVEATEAHVVLETNPRSWHQPARIEEIEFKFYKTLDEGYDAFRAEEIDGLSAVSGELLRQLETLPDIQILSVPLARYEMVYLNLQKPDELPFFSRAKSSAGPFLYS